METPTTPAAQADRLAAEGWLTCREASRRLGRHITTIYRLIDIGQGGRQVAGLRIGRARYVRAADLAEAMGPVGAALLGLADPPPPGPSTAPSAAADPGDEPPF